MTASGDFPGDEQGSDSRDPVFGLLLERKFA
jgi:hypothetical protein